MVGYIALAVFHISVLGQQAVTTAAATDGVRPGSRGPPRADVGECVSSRGASRGEANGLAYPYVGNRIRTSVPTPTNASQPDVPASFSKNLFIFLTIDDAKYRLKLKLNEEILSANVTAQEDRQVVIKTVEPCFYQGTCTSDSHAENICTTAVSTCHGLRGFIRINESMYTVRPIVDNQDRSIHCKPHVIQPVSQSVTSLGCQQGVSSLDAQLPFEVLDDRILTADPSIGNAVQIKAERNKMLRLAVVVDKSFFRRRNDASGLAFNYVSLLVNAVDMHFRKLNLRISLTCYQAWRSKDEFPVMRNSKENLLNLIVHMPKLRICTAYDAVVLLSGQPVDEGQVGSSVQDSVCTDRAAVVVHGNGSIEQLPSTARAVAHHIGHVLGLLHDGDGCICRESKDCIMNSNLQGPAGDFSQCSRSRLDILWKYGPASCLSQRKQQAYQSYCGNGILERGEECDCGPAAKCHLVDPCCDGATCMLKVWATCRSGTCCEGCRVRNSTHLCRSARTDCDVPEYCNGMSGECPPDVIVQDGEPCAASALCYSGQCIERGVQCERLWGPGSHMAGDLCYLLNNPQGTEYGHCGVTAHQSGTAGSSMYARCSGRDALCGLLQCAGGSPMPHAHGVSYRIETVGIKGVNQYQCKSVNAVKALVNQGPGPDGVVDAGFVVSDGTKCGEGSMCVARSCVNISTLPSFRPCPYDAGNGVCSGHGRCTSIGTCHCDSDFGLPDCSLKLNVTVARGKAPAATQPVDDGLHSSVDAGGLLQVVELKWLIVIAVSLAVLVVGLVLTFIFCMRQRRYCVTKQNAPQVNGNTVRQRNCECRDKEVVTASKHDGIKRRRRRRFRKPLWSDSDSESTSDEESRNLSPPIIVHNDPAASDQRLRQPERGILKKKTLSLIGEERDNCSHEEADDGSASSCSCPADGHCSCSGGDDDDDDDGGGQRPADGEQPGAVKACGSDEMEPMLGPGSLSQQQQQLMLPLLQANAGCCPPMAAGGQRGRLAVSLRDDSGHSTETSPMAADGSLLLQSAIAVGSVVSNRCSTCRGPSSGGEAARCSRMPCYEGPSSSQIDSATDSAVELCDALLVTSSMSTLNEACIVSTVPVSSSSRRLPPRTTATHGSSGSAACTKPCSCSGSREGSDCSSAADGQASAERGRRPEHSETIDCLRLYELAAGQFSPSASARAKRSANASPDAAGTARGAAVHTDKPRAASYSSDSSGGSSSECCFCPEPGAAAAAVEQRSLQDKTNQVST